MSFPGSHYHGLTAAFDLDIACDALPDAVREFPVTPERIIARWQLGDYPRVLHGVDAMEHIFGELYRVPEQILVVDDGRIAECGTHDALIRQNGLYRRFTDIRRQAEGWKL